MRQRYTLILLIVAFLSAPLNAQDLVACRHLLESTPPDENASDTKAYFRDAELAYRDCRAASLPFEIRLSSARKYAVAQRIRGDAREAINGYREAVTLLDSAGADRTAELLEVLGALSFAEAETQLSADAIAHASRSLELRRQHFGERSSEAVSGMVTLGLVHATLKNFADAEQALRSAVEIAQSICGPRCEPLAEAYSGMYALYAAQGNDVQARRYDLMTTEAKPLNVRIRAPKWR